MACYYCFCWCTDDPRQINLSSGNTANRMRRNSHVSTCRRRWCDNRRSSNPEVAGLPQGGRRWLTCDVSSLLGVIGRWHVGFSYGGKAVLMLIWTIGLWCLVRKRAARPVPQRGTRENTASAVQAFSYRPKGAMQPDQKTQRVA